MSSDRSVPQCRQRAYSIKLLQAKLEEKSAFSAMKLADDQRTTVAPPIGFFPPPDGVLPPP